MLSKKSPEGSRYRKMKAVEGVEGVELATKEVEVIVD